MRSSVKRSSRSTAFPAHDSPPRGPFSLAELGDELVEDREVGGRLSACERRPERRHEVFPREVLVPGQDHYVEQILEPMLDRRELRDQRLDLLREDRARLVGVDLSGGILAEEREEASSLGGRLDGVSETNVSASFLDRPRSRARFETRWEADRARASLSFI